MLIPQTNLAIPLTKFISWDFKNIMVKVWNCWEHAKPQKGHNLLTNKEMIVTWIWMPWWRWWEEDLLGGQLVGICWRSSSDKPGPAAADGGSRKHAASASCLSATVMLAISTRSPQYAELLWLLQLLLLLLLLLPSLGITIAVKIVRHKNSRNPIKCLQQEARNS